MKTREALGCQTNFKLRRYEIGPETLNPCRAGAIKIKVRYDEALIALVHLVLFTWFMGIAHIAYFIAHRYNR